MRERVGERPTEQESGANRRKGGDGFELTRVYGTPRQHRTIKW